MGNAHELAAAAPAGVAGAPHGGRTARMAGAVVLTLGAAAGAAAVLLDWGVPARAAVVAATCVALAATARNPTWRLT